MRGPRTLCSIRVNNPGGGGGSSTPTGWPLTYWNTLPGNGASTLVFSLSGNKLNIFCFYLPVQVQFGTLYLDIATTDAVNNCDAGLYSFAGSLVAHIGAQTIPSSGTQGFAVVGGSKTVNPGIYGFATTSTAATAAIYMGGNSGNHANWRYTGAGDYAVTAGGVLPNSITFPPAGIAGSEVTANFALGA